VVLHAAGEPLQRLQQQLVNRAEVVVDEAVVLPGLGGELPRRDSRRALLDQQPLGGIEKASTLASLIERWPSSTPTSAVARALVI
jgi:hypothetical protein